MRFRVVLAVVLWVVWGSACWPIQIDDQFISLAYARSFVEQGMFLWSNSAKVEGYSNFLWVLLQAGMLGLKLDPDLGGKCISIGAGLATLLYLERRLPTGALGTWTLFAIASWIPFSWWSFTGMETSLYAALLTIGWGESARGNTRTGFGLLWLASVTRPEGPAHWILAVALFGRQQRSLQTVGGLIGAMLLYQGLRVAWFEEWLPTPFLVKVQESPWELDTPLQALQELLSMGALLLLLGLGGRPKVWVFAPFLIQLGLELSADTDWMGHGRLLLPGVMASAGLWAGGLRYRPLRWAWNLPLAALTSFFAFLDPPGIGVEQLRFRDTDPLFHVWSQLQLPLDTPAIEDVLWVVRHVPDHTALLTGDVGMVGNIPSIPVMDLNGLTNREVALANLGVQELEPLAPQMPRILRLLGDDPPDPWMGGPYQTLAVWKVEPFKVRWLSAGPVPEMEPATVLHRWELLRERHPQQGALWRSEAEDLASQGALLEALSLMDRYSERWPEEPKGRSLRSSLSFPTRKAGNLVSDPISDAQPLSLGVKVPPGSEVLIRMRWDCQSEYQRKTVKGEEIVALPTLCAAGARLQLWVQTGIPTPAEVWLTVAG